MLYCFIISELPFLDFGAQSFTVIYLFQCETERVYRKYRRIINKNVSLKLHEIVEQYMDKRLDLGTVLGVGGAFGLVSLAILFGGSITAFLDFPSLLIVVGGTLGATLINYPLQDFIKAFRVLRPTFFPETISPGTRMERIINMARTARGGGALALEAESDSEEDPFLRKCLELMVDGSKPEEIRHIMELELAFPDCYRRAAQLFQTMGTIAPALGLIGTLIGLVQMLGNLEEPAAIAPAMAVALITTFYGAILANLVFLPVAGKLHRRSQEELLIKEMTVEGILSIATGAHPRLVEQHLMGFLPAEERWTQFG